MLPVNVMSESSIIAHRTSGQQLSDELLAADDDVPASIDDTLDADDARLAVEVTLLDCDDT